MVRVILIILLLSLLAWIFLYPHLIKKKEKKEKKKDANAEEVPIMLEGELKIRDVLKNKYENYKTQITAANLAPQDPVKFEDDEVIYLQVTYREGRAKEERSGHRPFFIGMLVVTNYKIIFYLTDGIEIFNIDEIVEVELQVTGAKIKFKNRFDYISFGLTVEEVVKFERLMEKFKIPVDFSIQFE